MNAPESFQALRRANPRNQAGFAESVEATADRLHARMIAAAADVSRDAAAPGPTSGRSRPRRRVVGVSTAASLVAAAVAAALLMVSSPGVPSAAAAVKHAATVTAASAERSGTAVVRITRDGKPWAGTTIRWHGRDIGVTRDFPSGRGPGSRFLVVDGVLYSSDLHGGWVELGSPRNIDPNTGTTPDEYLSAVREDVGGVTLHRIVDGMTGLTTSHPGDGSTVYSGTVAAGLIARETGFEEGQSIRVLPFGYAAHDEAANPGAPLHAAVTVGTDRTVRQIVVTWGTGASAWNYRVEYSRLGATPAPVAPAHAPSLRDRSRAAKSRTGSGPGG